MMTLITCSILTLLSLLAIHPLFAQQVIFTEDFETGTSSSQWGAYLDGEETVTAVDMSFAPAPLANGGTYVGYLQDADGSYTGAAIALAGMPELHDYAIEADVYCYAYNVGGSAYTGLVVYSDVESGTYIKLAADFDADQRLRLYNNRLNTSTFEYTFHHAFKGSDVLGGIPRSDGWHHMKVEVRTINSDSIAYWCYFDGALLEGCPVYDIGDDRVVKGRFGLFSFQQSGEGIPAFFDNIVVTSLVPSSVGDQESGSTVGAWLRNEPNPFSNTTHIGFSVPQSSVTNLAIYDVLGRKVKQVVAGYRYAGEYTANWDGADDDGVRLPAGTYVCRLVVGPVVIARTIVFGR